jgi:hypothetical protein
MARAVSHAGFTTISLLLAAADAAAAVARGTPSTGPRSRLWVEEPEGALAAPLPLLLPLGTLPSTRFPFSRGLLAAFARGGNCRKEILKMRRGVGGDNLGQKRFVEGGVPKHARQ